MAWPVYSTRFVAQRLPDVWARYYVPAGKRAVIKSVVCTNWQNNATQVTVRAANLYVAIVDFQASIGSRDLAVMFVVNEGEAIELYHVGAAVESSVHGFLLDGALAAAEDPPMISAQPGAPPPPHLRPELDEA